MGMTMSEKIFAEKAGRNTVAAGEIVTAKVDFVGLLDASGAHVASAFAELGAKRVWDPSKVMGLLDNAVPAPTVQAASLRFP